MILLACTGLTLGSLSVCVVNAIHTYTAWVLALTGKTGKKRTRKAQASGSRAGVAPPMPIVAEQERQLLIRLRQLREQQQEADKRPLRTGFAEEGGR